MLATKSPSEINGDSDAGDIVGGLAQCRGSSAQGKLRTSLASRSVVAVKGSAIYYNPCIYRGNHNGVFECGGSAGGYGRGLQDNAAMKMYTIARLQASSLDLFIEICG